MKILSKLLIIVSMILYSNNIFAFASNIPRPLSGSSYQNKSSYQNHGTTQTTYSFFSFQKNYSCPGQYYYGYNFDSSTYDYQVDTACVDFCIDKEHTLQQCMRSCSQQ